MNNEELKNKIISEIQRIAKEHNSKNISKLVFKRNSNISENQIYKVFGSWNEAVKESGLEPNLKKEKLSDDELLNDILNVCNKLNTIPTGLSFNRFSKHDVTTLTKRFKSWNNTLLNFKNWLKVNHPDSPYIDLIEDKKESNIKTEFVTINEENKSNNNQEIAWPKTKNVLYGKPIDFRGLRHEPINEQGVVFLFGKISEELGFIIEAIRTGYPDCEGKRLVDKKRSLWQKVSIEFGFQSKNFLDHGHNPDKCDVIICWEDNWPDCPIEVIELKSKIKDLV